MIASESRNHRVPGAARPLGGAGLLAFGGILVFAVVVAAWALRGPAMDGPGAADVASFKRLAPYAIAFAVAHGLAAYFAAGTSLRGRHGAGVVALAGALIAGAGGAALAAGWRPFPSAGPGAMADGVTILVVLAFVDGAAAFLLSGRRDP